MAKNKGARSQGRPKKVGRASLPPGLKLETRDLGEDAKFDREAVAKFIRDMDRVIRWRRKLQRDLLDRIEQKLEHASRAAMIEFLAKAGVDFRRMDWGTKAAL